MCVKVSKNEYDKIVYDTKFSTTFWEILEDCLKTSKLLLHVLRIAYGDERPALVRVAAAIDYARVQLTKIFVDIKIPLRKKMLTIIEDRWN